MSRPHWIDIPRPTGWELWELSIQFLLVPLIVLPQRAQMWLCRWLARLLVRPGSDYRRKLESAMPSLSVKSSRGKLVEETETYLLFERVMNLRGVLIPGWQRDVELAGLEYVEAGITAGKGVILWVQPCLASTQAVKQALHDAGFPLVHLSRPAHGFSPHPFGMRFVNPILRRAESRFLAERIVIDGDHTIGPLRRMKALLKENRVISITVTPAASHVDEFEFLGGALKLPRGPIELAQSTGAVLLPVFTNGARAVPKVEISPSVSPTSRDPESIAATERSIVSWLGNSIEVHPLDWIGWRADLFVSAASDANSVPSAP